MNLKTNKNQVRKKALIITYYWPPAGGPGVQRWLKFVKYFKDFNIEPIVYTPENPSYPLRDESLVKEIPNDITILKQPIKEPYGIAGLLSKDSVIISKGIIPEAGKQSLLQRLLLYIRGNFFIPDARKNWIKPSVNYLYKYIYDNEIATVITTGPPHSLHLIGMQLKRRTGVRWLADFRDPWTTIGYQNQLKLTRRSIKKHKQLEKEVLNEADGIVVTSFNTSKEFQNITNQPITVISNGYDSEETGPVELDDKFSLSHIGSLLSKRNPEILWRVLADIARKNKIFESKFQLNLVGTVSEEVLYSLDKFGLMRFINIVGYVGHEEAIRFQRKSQVLLLIEIDSEDTRSIIPGKLFEYMASNRPIVAIGPSESDVEKIIKDTNCGNYFNYSDYDILKKTILAHFEAFQNNDLQSHPIGIQKYHRRALTKQLATLIEKINS